MTYRDPRCVMVADSFGAAAVVVSWLEKHDIQAEVMNQSTSEALSAIYVGGVSSNGIEVWVLDSEQVPRAIELLAEQEMLRTTRTAARQAIGEPIDALCEDCGTATTFPPEMAGTVQDCPNCGAYLDVGEEEDEPDERSEEEDDSPPSDGIQQPPHVRPE